MSTNTLHSRKTKEKMKQMFETQTVDSKTIELYDNIRLIVRPKQLTNRNLGKTLDYKILRIEGDELVPNSVRSKSNSIRDYRIQSKYTTIASGHLKPSPILLAATINCIKTQNEEISQTNISDFEEKLNNSQCKNDYYGSIILHICNLFSPV